MADQELAAAMSTMTVSHPPPPPRPNFPLPRELRDKIHGYLLDHKYNRLKRTYDGDIDQARSKHSSQSYHFHTNILAVNRTIHNEAEKVLYEHNIFVVASHQFPSFGTELSTMLSLPFVTERNFSRMEYHSLRVNVKVSDSTAPNNRGGRVKGVVLLVDHIEALCDMLARSFLYLPDRSVLLWFHPTTSRPIIRERQLPSAVMRASLKFELRSTKFRAMDRELQSMLLSPFVQVVYPNLQVSFIGQVCDTEQTHGLEQAMAPILNCYDARSWALERSIRQNVKNAHDALDFDELEVAAELLQKLSDQPAILTIQACMEDGSPKQRGSATFALIQSYIQATISLGWICFKMRQMEGVAMLAANIDGLIEDPEWEEVFDACPSELTAYATHFLFLSSLFLCYPRYSVGTVLESLSSFGDDFAHITHDRTLLLEHALKPSNAFTQDLIPFDESSAAVLKVPRFPHCKNCNFLKKPARFVGWQNLDMIRSLDTQTKQAINRRVASLGLRKIDFSE